ncbi:hypothetical protein LSAT2_028876, partial [Lamellibrachia satsuma]
QNYGPGPSYRWTIVSPQFQMALGSFSSDKSRFNRVPLRGNEFVVEIYGLLRTGVVHAARSVAKGRAEVCQASSAVDTAGVDTRQLATGS